MPTYEWTISQPFPHTPEAIWHWLNDPERIASLNPDVDHLVVKTPGPIGSGTQFDMVFAVNRPTASCTVQFFEPGVRLINYTPLTMFQTVFLGHHYHGFIFSEAEEAGHTLVTQEFRFEPSPPGRFIAGTIRKGWSFSAENYFNGLKRSLGGDGQA